MNLTLSPLRQMGAFAAQTAPTLLRRYGFALALTTALLVGCSPDAGDSAAQSYEARLANHLAETGATMYGAYWCPHCADQKEMFGEAIEQVPYVECAPDGENSQTQLCQEKGIQGFPTWEIEGEFYPGTRSLEELATLSNFPEE